MADRARGEVLAANPRLPIVALPIDEAAAALGMSAKSFNKHVRHELKLIRDAGHPLVPVRELERWADRHAEPVLTTKGAT